MQTCLYVPAIYLWLLLLPRSPCCPVCLCVHLTFHLCHFISLFNVIKSSHSCLCPSFTSLLLCICYQPAHMFAQICVCLLSPFCVLCFHITHVLSSCLLICLLCCLLISFPCFFLLLLSCLSLMELSLCPAGFFTPLHHLITLLSWLLLHSISVVVLLLLLANAHLHLCKSLFLNVLVHIPLCVCLHRYLFALLFALCVPSCIFACVNISLCVCTYFHMCLLVFMHPLLISLLSYHLIYICVLLVHSFC